MTSEDNNAWRKRSVVVGLLLYPWLVTWLMLRFPITRGQPELGGQFRMQPPSQPSTLSPPSSPSPSPSPSRQPLPLTSPPSASPAPSPASIPQLNFGFNNRTIIFPGIIDDEDELGQARSRLSSKIDQDQERSQSIVAFEAHLRNSTIQYGSSDVVEVLPSGTISLKKLLKGSRITMVHFWATWCHPCIEEMPYINALWKLYASNPTIRILIVSVDQDPEDAREYMNRTGYPFPLYLDPNGFLLERSIPFKDLGLPATLLVDYDGSIRNVSLGPLTQEAAIAIEKELSSVAR